MNLHLIDTNPDVVSAWRTVFAPHSEIDIQQTSIINVASDAVVSPANSHGFMDGGIDLIYLSYFGQELQDRVRTRISQRPEQLLPVGAAELIDTRHEKIPWLIIAPTMEMPEAVPSINAHRSLAAVLRLADRHPEISDICCPGLCTGVGQVSPTDSAIAMEEAYSTWKQSKPR